MEPTIATLNEKLVNALNAGGFCDKHPPNGGSRNCIICGIEALSFALDRISYLCGPPNEMKVSEYSTHYDESKVIEQVKKIITAEKPQWIKNPPTEIGSWWWWNGDHDSMPIHINILNSLPSGDCFACAEQYGWTRAQPVKEMGGWWMPLPEPALPE